MTRYEDSLVILVKGIEVRIHYHYAVQLVVSLDKPYRTILDHQEVDSTRGFLIDSHVPHACQSADATVLVISIDATSIRGKLLKQQLSNRKFALLNEIFSIKEINRFSESYWKYCQGTNTEFDPLYLIQSLCEGKNDATSFDERSLAAINFIHQHINETIQLNDIATYVNLSESRLRHSFSEQVGIPITSYILWTRMKIALREMLKPDVTLSKAAQQANFSDHAHLTRTFQRMFGVSPSLLLKHGQFLQVFGL
jgi:AraC-like DNA-binding protein